MGVLVEEMNRRALAQGSDAQRTSAQNDVLFLDTCPFSGSCERSPLPESEPEA